MLNVATGNTVLVESILSQFRASLAMLQRVIEICPEELWLNRSYRSRSWHIAYHSLFYTNLYSYASEAEFTPWPKHQTACRLLGGSEEDLVSAQPYSRAELLCYHQICCAAVERNVAMLPFNASSGFDWLPMNRFELHLYSLRHIQHHTGQFAERLRCASDIALPWVRLGERTN